MKQFQLPLSDEDRKRLRAGETVLLSGTITTARDAAHSRLYEMLKSDQSLPIDLATCTIYYAGPSPTPENSVIGSDGPTTAGRMDAYMPVFLDNGLKVTIGKGKRSPEVKAAMKAHEAVYFTAVGGAGAYYAGCVKKVTLIAFEDLQSEAIRELEVVDFPVIVAIDTLGTDLYER